MKTSQESNILIDFIYKLGYFFLFPFIIWTLIQLFGCHLFIWIDIGTVCHDLSANWRRKRKLWGWFIKSSRQRDSLTAPCTLLSMIYTIIQYLPQFSQIIWINKHKRPLPSAVGLPLCLTHGPYNEEEGAISTVKNGCCFYRIVLVDKVRLSPVPFNCKEKKNQNLEKSFFVICWKKL